MTFSASFRSVVIGALIFGLSANAAPGGTPGSPTSSTTSNLSDYGVCDAYSKHSRLGDMTHVLLGGDTPHTRELVERNKFETGGYPDPTKKMTAYHGTAERRVKSLQQEIVIWKSRGDHSKNGGFYLTPSFKSAGQWSCHGRGEDVKVAYIFEYEWDGPSAKVMPYSEWQSEEEYENFCNANYCDYLKYESPGMTDEEKKEKLKQFDQIPQDYDLLEGPMLAVKDIGSKFWQYTVVRDAGLKHLTKVHVYKIPCKYFPKGDNLEMKDTFGPSDDLKDQDKEDVGLNDSETEIIE